jgi:signal recognition particle subunit SRP72
LERRAKNREEYLKKLTLEGKYNPDRPTPPDPERWIPKSQRSYNKRGRKARTTFVGSQGAGAGTEKDASRLDVAAKLAAQSSGASSKPSTAHLAVSTSGPTKNRRR